MSAPDTNHARAPMEEAALDWALRMAEPEADWDAFTTWLEQDAATAVAYDRACAALEAATIAVSKVPDGRLAGHDHRVSPTPAPSRPLARRRWIGGALAAALLGVVGMGVWQERDRTYEIATSPGERRDVRLADGSSITLAGGSRIRLDAARPRLAVIVAGQALFRVRHDASDPFRVQAGDLALTDIGTVFDVSMLGARTRVVVAEGAVLIDPEGARVRLDPGEAITAMDGTLRRGRQEAEDVGLWREGRLTYDDATMSDVAEDLTRQLGWRITAAPRVARRTFNGTLETASFRNDPGALGDLLGLNVRRGPGGWTMDERR